MKQTSVFFLAMVTMLVGFPLVLALIITKRAWKRWSNVLKRTFIDAKRSPSNRPSTAVAITTEGEPHGFV